MRRVVGLGFRVVCLGLRIGPVIVGTFPYLPIHKHMSHSLNFLNDHSWDYIGEYQSGSSGGYEEISPWLP